MPTAEEIGRIADQWAIRDTLARYWRGIDRRDTALVASTYHPRAYDDHGYYKGPVEGFLETLAPSVWATFANTQHFSGHIAVDLDPFDRDVAIAESYAEAHHIMAGDEPASGRDLVYGLRYVDRFERRGGEWRIAHRVCTWDWHRQDEGLGLPLPDTYYRGRHSSEDLAYTHPTESGRPQASAVLQAKRACLDTLARYTRGIDRCDLETVRSTYHEDALDDHGGYQGDVEGFLEWVRPTVMDTFSCTMHKLGNRLVVVEKTGPGETPRAYAETYAIAHHVASPTPTPTPTPETDSGASDMIMGVRYLDRLEDRGEGWKIADRRMSFEWERSVVVGPQAAFPGFSVGRRDGRDPVLASSPRVSSSGSATPARDRDEADRSEIDAVLLRYCRGVDRRDREMIRGTYHADAYDDHGAYQGDLEGFLDFVEKEVWARFRTTMHKLGQILVELEGDVAHSESYAICHHVVAEAGVDQQDMVMGIRYVDRLERREGEWRIARRELRWEWLRMDALSPLDDEWTPGRASAEDPILCALSNRPAEPIET